MNWWNLLFLFVGCGLGMLLMALLFIGGQPERNFGIPRPPLRDTDTDKGTW